MSSGRWYDQMTEEDHLRIEEYLEREPTGSITLHHKEGKIMSAELKQSFRLNGGKKIRAPRTRSVPTDI